MAYSSEPATRGFIPPRDDHERLVMRRAEELARAAESSGRVRWTSFLSDREQDLCVAAMNRAGCACYGFEGGFEQAERKLLCIRPAGAYGEPPLCCVRVEFGQPGPGHRDLLGAPPILPPPPLPQPACSLREALFAPVERLPLSDCLGRVAAGQLAPYPPGVPVVAPGEVILEKELAYLKEIGYNNLDVPVLCR